MIVFGDTQPYDLEQLDFLSRDVISQVIGTDAAFGITLGDLVGDDLALFEPLNRAIARIGVPWYNVIGNHDMNYDAQDDAGSDESFERVYGPATYAFDYARAHFIVLDDVIYDGADRDPPSRQHYHGGFDADALAFVRAYLEGVPRDELVVLLMHMPLAGPPPFGFAQSRELLALLADRPNTLSFSSHTHMQYQLFLGPEAGFTGKAPHLHVNQGAVAGSWWLGARDELGIPHATMRDGTPNGWSVLEIDGERYRLRFQAARRPESEQMSIHAPAAVTSAQAGASEVIRQRLRGIRTLERRAALRRHTRVAAPRARGAPGSVLSGAARARGRARTEAGARRSRRPPTRCTCGAAGCRRTRRPVRTRSRCAAATSSGRPSAARRLIRIE